MSAPTAYERDTERYDWVWVYRAVCGRARAADLSMLELDDVIAKLTRDEFTDNAIATHLHTNIRLIHRRRELNSKLAKPRSSQCRRAPRR